MFGHCTYLLYNQGLVLSMGSYPLYCSRCQCGRVLDPLGMSDADVGHWCGLCDVQYDIAVSSARMQLFTSHRSDSTTVEVLMRLQPAGSVIAGYLSGSPQWFRRKLYRQLLLIVLHPSTLFYKFRSVWLTSTFFTHRDLIDLILDFVCRWQSVEPSRSCNSL